MEDATSERPGSAPPIGRHASPGIGSVNTWWIEAESGIVLIDAQRQAIQALEVTQAVAASGKPVSGHPADPSAS